MVTASLMAPATRKTPEGIVDNRLVLDGISWRTYEELLGIFEDKRLRITFDRGTLEIMTISPLHEQYRRIIDLLIFVLVEESNQKIRGLGSMTFKRPRKKRGLEPDQCYWIQNYEQVRDVRKYDPQKHTPPDLVVEIDMSASSVDRVGIYEAMGVPEVWRWDEQKLELRVLNDRRKYNLVESSFAFPGFNPSELIPWVQQAFSVDDIELVRAFRCWVRDQITAGTGQAAAGQPPTRSKPRKKQ
jgi:Uma2 family endonuclease